MPIEGGLIMELLLKGLYRGFIPFGIMLIISLSSKLQGLTADAKSYFYYGLIFFFLGLASVIYQMNEWSFPKQIIVHYLVMLMTVFPTLLISGFYPLNSFNDLLHVYVQFNKAGIILFTVTYLISYLFSLKTAKDKGNYL